MWPASPLTTYNPETTPVIHASDLNLMQSGTVGLVNGTYNVSALTTTTGTPGTVITPTLGTIVASATLAGSTAPTTSLPLGTIARGLVPIGWAYINASGSLSQGYNILSEPGAVSGSGHPMAGQYYVVFNPASAGIANGVVLANHADMLDARFVATAYLAFGGHAAAEILIRDSGGTPVDSAFQVLLFAE